MDYDILQRAFEYNCETGEIRWKIKPSKNIQIGSLAGHKSKLGYVQIGINGKLYLAHRLAWLLFYKEIPPKMLDHINGDKADNRIVNLRAASNAENMRNMGKTGRNKTGYKGVSFNKKLNKYVASIGYNMKTIYLGLHQTPEDAHAAYCEAAKRLHGSYFKP